MPVFILSFLRGLNLKNVLYLCGVAGLAFTIYTAAMFIKDKYEAEAEVTRLELVVDGYKESIRVLKEANAQKDRALAAADAARAELENQREIYQSIRRDAASAPEKDDGTVAPVLRRALDALGGM
ncbi:hypothetical protein [Phaeobacter phage MD18]|nr:hypothetical protein [Phaeobacter phage MD18]